jgi:copper chaperone
MEEIVIQVQGMSCSHCIAAVGRLLEEVPGVTGYDVHMESGTASVSVSDGDVSKEDLIKRINDSEIYTAL